jgi:uncharacterized protein YbaP (TraB family)
MIQINERIIGRFFRHALRASYCIALTFLFSNVYAQIIASDGFSSSHEAKNGNSSEEKWLLFEIRQSDETKGYIFGATHTLIDAKELPSKIKTALLKSTSLVFESNYFDAGLAEEAAKILTSNPSGKTLDAMLLPQTYEKFQKLYEFEKIPAETQSKINLWSPYMAITVLDTKCTTIQAVGIFPEQTINNFALNNKMKIIGLESGEDQLGWMSRVSKKQWDDYFTAYVGWIRDENCSAKFTSSYKKISTYVVNGDADAIFDEYMRFYSQDIPVKWFQEQYFLTPRNVPLAEKMVKTLQNEPAPFFLMGAAHLGGKNGLLTLLRARGYEVVQQQ